MQGRVFSGVIGGEERQVEGGTMCDGRLPCVTLCLGHAWEVKEGVKEGGKEGVKEGVEEGVKEGVEEGVEEGVKEVSILLEKHYFI